MVDKNAHYLMCKGGVFYFTRHMPNDLQKHYETTRIVICLKTRSKNAALKASQSMAAKLDDFWLQMRIAEMKVPASSKLTNKHPQNTSISSAPKLSDALEKYCTLKGINKGRLFFIAAERNIGYVIKCLGDHALEISVVADGDSCVTPVGGQNQDGGEEVSWEVHLMVLEYTIAPYIDTSEI